MSKVLLTGFGPFLGEKVNPSEILARQLSNELPNVESLLLPVEFRRAFTLLDSHLKHHRYDYVLMFGQAAGRHTICLEKVALNWIQTEHADEAGQKPVTGPIEGDLPLAYMTPFPVDSVCQKLQASGMPVSISFSAGTFVCNELYFRILSRYPEMQSLFIHVPLIPEQVEQVKKPQLAIETQLTVLKGLINELRSGQ